VEEFGDGVNVNTLRIRMCNLRKVDGTSPSNAKSPKEIGNLSPVKSGRITKCIPVSTIAKLDPPKNTQKKSIESDTFGEVKIKGEYLEV
jgi:hypothetical protein